MYKIVNCLLFTLFIASCVQSPRVIDPQLLEIDSFLESYPDSALTALENFPSLESLDKYNESYYNILLTAARNKMEISLLESDVLIDKAIKNLSRKNDPILLARAYLYKGRIWAELKEPENASSILQKAINLLISSKKEDTETLAKIYDDLGNIYIDQDLYNLALETFSKEYQVDQKIGNSTGMVLSLKNIGKIFLLKNELDSSYFYYQEAIKYTSLSPDSIILLDYLHNDLAVYYEMQEEYDLALHYLNQIKERRDNYEYNKATILIKKQLYDSAFPILFNLANSSNTDNMSFKMLSSLPLGEIEYNKGNYKNAYNYIKEYSIVLDSIIFSRKTKEIKILDYKYNLERKTSQIKSRIQLLGIVIISIFLLIGVVSYFLYLLKKKKREIIDKEKDNELLKREKKILLKEQEINLLNDKYLNLQGEIISLQKQKNEHFSNFNEEIHSKENEINELKKQIETKRMFREPIYKHLLEIEQQVKLGQKIKFNNKLFNQLFEEIEISFPLLLSEIREEYPPIERENLFIICLMKLGFTSKFIGYFLNLNDSSVRQRIVRLKPKLPVFLKNKINEE